MGCFRAPYSNIVSSTNITILEAKKVKKMLKFTVFVG